MILFTPILFMAATMTNSTRPIFDVWPHGAPGGWSKAEPESTETDQTQHFEIVKNVSHPTLEFFKSSNSLPGASCVLVCPGGGYYIEAIQHEGWEIAERLNRSGIDAAVLKYRLPNRDTDHPLHIAPLQDAQRAIRCLRSKSHELGFSAEKVGILGFSAGGHLAAVTSTAFSDSYPPIDSVDRESARPNFTVLIYPAYLAEDNKPVLDKSIPIAAGCPPAFIVQTMDDPIHVENAFAYALACKEVGVPAELHIYPKGGHGYGIRSKQPGLDRWIDTLIDWIERSIF